VDSDTEAKLAVQAFFIHGVLCAIPDTSDVGTHTGWGPWEAVLGGPLKNTGYENPSSFQIISVGADGGSRLFVGNLAMHSEATSEPVQKGAWIADVTYEPAASLLGYADVLFGVADNPPLSKDLGIAWVSGDDHGHHSILEFSIENFPKNSPDPEPHGFGIDRGHMASSFELTFATQTTFPQRDGNAVATESLEIAHEGFLGDRDDGWCMGVRIDSPESVHALYDLVV
jgi:hypothetical protein